MKTMTKNFTFYAKRLLLFMLLVCVFTPQSKAQKKAIAYLLNPVVYVNLMLPSADSLLLVDGTGALYSNKYSAGVDDYDAGKLSNFNENICLFRDGKKLAIEARPMPKQTDTLFIHIWGVRQPIYDLQINLHNPLPLLPLQSWLIDNYLHTQIQINLVNKTHYRFTTKVDTDSYLNRFMIVFERNSSQQNGMVSVSNATQLNTGTVSVYPNPVIGNRLTLQFNNMVKDNYTVKLSSLTGETLAGMNIMHAGNNNKYYLLVNSVYTKGIYTVTISGKNTEKIIHLPIIVNN
jgi:type IX secretion system substrate protein